MTDPVGINHILSTNSANWIRDETSRYALQTMVSELWSFESNHSDLVRVEVWQELILSGRLVAITSQTTN